MSELIQWPRAKWWEKQWNPVIGCKPCSPACEHCYAAAWAKRFGQSFEPHESSQSQKKAGFAPTPFRMKFDPAALERCPQADFKGGIYVIDNVLCTGVTATAAIKAIQDCSGLDAKVVTLAYATWR